MKTREKVGADIPNRFDYQLALSMSYLIDSTEQITIIIETLEDFAIVRNNNDKEIVDFIENIISLEYKEYGKYWDKASK